MSFSQNIRDYINHNDNNRKSHWKLLQYKTLQNAINAESYVNVEDILFILKGIDGDISSTNATIQSVVYDIIKVLTNKINENYGLSDFPNELIELAFSDDVNVYTKDILKNHIEVMVKSEMKHGNPEKLLFKVSNPVINNQLSDVLKTCYKIYLKKDPETFVNKTIPSLIYTNHDNSEVLLKVVNELKEDFPLSSMNPKLLQQFKNNVKQYIEIVKSLQSSHKSIWEQLWIFLIEYLGKTLHTSVGLTNKCMEPIENAFRSAVLENRLMAHNCWKVLIDNYSLNPEHLIARKSLKLLLTPLTNSFSKVKGLTIKRFDLWIHLFKALDNNGAMCVSEYLTFCYGFNVKNKSVTEQDNTKPNFDEILTRKVALPIREESTEVLLEILGHNSSCGCLNINGKYGLKQLVTNENFIDLADAVLFSIVECFMCLKEWADSETQEKVTLCGSNEIFTIILNLDKETKESALKKVHKQLTYVVECCNKKPEKYDYILQSIINAFILVFKSSTEHLDEIFVFPVLKTLLNYNSSPEICRQLIFKIIGFAKNNSSKMSFFKNGFNLIIETDPRKYKTILLFSIWLEFARLHQSCEGIETSILLKFLMWPVLSFHCVSVQLQKAVISVWPKSFNTIDNSNSQKYHLLQEINKILLEKPLLTPNIAKFVAMIATTVNSKDGKFIVEILQITAKVLTFPNLTKEDLINLNKVIINYLAFSLKYYTDEQRDKIIENICYCIQFLLEPHKLFAILHYFQEFIQKVPAHKYNSISNILSPYLQKLTNYNDADVIQISMKILSTLSSHNRVASDKKINSSSKINRNVTILNMLQPVKNLPQVSTNDAINLIGNNENQSPFKIRGSQLKKSSGQKETVKVANLMPKENNINKQLVKENTIDYIIINSEVKIDPKKLSENQKDNLRKKRDDIPALYEDLTQSSTFLSENSTSLHINDENSKNKESTNAIELRKDDLVTSLDNAIQEISSNSQLTPEKSKENLPNSKDETLNDDELKEECLDKLNTSEITVEEHALKIDTSELSTEIKIDETSDEYQGINEQTVTFDSSVTSVNKSKRSNKKETNLSSSGRTIDTFENNDYNNCGVNIAKVRDKINRELKRIQMDIVGADNFTTNLPKKRQRKSIENETKYYDKDSNSPESLRKMRPRAIMCIHDKDDKTESTETTKKSVKSIQNVIAEMTSPKRNTYLNMISALDNSYKKPESTEKKDKGKRSRKSLVFKSSKDALNIESSLENVNCNDKNSVRNRKKTANTMSSSENEEKYASNIKQDVNDECNKKTPQSDNKHHTNFKLVKEDKNLESDSSKRTCDETIAKETNTLVSSKKMKRRLSTLDTDRLSTGNENFETVKPIIKENDSAINSVVLDTQEKKKVETVSSNENNNDEYKVKRVPKRRYTIDVPLEKTITNKTENDDNKTIPLRRRNSVVEEEQKENSSIDRMGCRYKFKKDEVSTYKIHFVEQKPTITHPIHNSEDIIESSQTSVNQSEPVRSGPSLRPRSPAIFKVLNASVNKSGPSLRPRSPMPQASSSKRCSSPKKSSSSNCSLSPTQSSSGTSKSQKQSVPKTNAKLSQSPKPNLRSHSPKPNLRSQSPKPNLRSQSPKPIPCSDSPKPNLRSQSPKPNLRSQSPKPIPCADNPKPNQRSQSPKPIPRSDSSKSKKRSQSPKPIPRSHSPKPNQRSQSPKPIPCLDNSKSKQRSQSPKPIPHSDSPKPNQCSQNPQPNQNQTCTPDSCKVNLFSKKSEKAKLPEGQTVYILLKQIPKINDNKNSLTQETSSTQKKVNPTQMEANPTQAELSVNNEIATCERETASWNSNPFIKYNLLLNLSDCNKQNFNTPDKQFCALDTVPLRSTDTTPAKRNELVSSPVTEDTPVRDSEFLNNTLNISPIKQCDDDKSNHTSHNKTIEKPILNESVLSTPVVLKSPSSRSERLLSLVSPKTQLSFNSKSPIFLFKVDDTNTSSPKTGRIKKIFDKCDETKVKETVKKTEEFNDLNNYLTFSKDVPSPLATPKVGILKKRPRDYSFSDPKQDNKRQKKVNFPDPPLTSEKLFVPDVNNSSTDNIEFIIDNSEEIKDDTEDLSLNTSKEEATREEIKDDTENLSLNTSKKEAIGEEISSENLTEETQGDATLKSVIETDKTNAFYPPLVNCKKDVNIILKKVTRPLFITTLLSEMAKKNIRTIGDLAKLTEAEINLFPFKSPKIMHVKKALIAYEKQVLKKHDLSQYFKSQSSSVVNKDNKKKLKSKNKKQPVVVNNTIKKKLNEQSEKKYATVQSLTQTIDSVARAFCEETDELIKKENNETNKLRRRKNDEETNELRKKETDGLRRKGSNEKTNKLRRKENVEETNDLRRRENDGKTNELIKQEKGEETNKLTRKENDEEINELRKENDEKEEANCCSNKETKLAEKSNEESQPSNEKELESLLKEHLTALKEKASDLGVNEADLTQIIMKTINQNALPPLINMPDMLSKCFNSLSHIELSDLITKQMKPEKIRLLVENLNEKNEPKASCSSHNEISINKSKMEISTEQITQDIINYSSENAIKICKDIINSISNSEKTTRVKELEELYYTVCEKFDLQLLLTLNYNAMKNFVQKTNKSND